MQIEYKNAGKKKLLATNYQLGPQQSENQCREHGVLFEILGADLGE